MQGETLFSIGQARAMMAVAGAMFAALALRWAWQVVTGEARRHGAVKVALLLLMSAPLVFWAGGKSGGPRSPEPTPEPGPETPAPVVPRREAAPGLHRYFAPSNFVADLSIFTRPTNAVTPSLWMRHSVCDDFQEALPDYIAGACGAVTTQPWGIDTPQLIKDCYETYAPFYATNSLIRGLGEFWAVTNENSKTFVWKNLAYNRNPSNLVSFAATVYDWGDFEFTYGNIPEGGFSSFVKLGAEALDMTQYAASGQTVRVEKNLEQDTEWWLENYPEICYTNAIGELIFDYDTNEWCFVQFVVESEEYNSALQRYCDACAALSNDVVHIEKYSVIVTPDEQYEDYRNTQLKKYDDIFMQMQTDRYGELTGFEGHGIGSLPQGVSQSDVVFLGIENGAVTNIMHWHIFDNSRILEKVGLPPRYEDYGIDSRTFLPFALRNMPVGNLEIYLRVSIAVPVGSTVKVHRDGKEEVASWACRDAKSGIITVPCRSGFVYDAHADQGFQSFYFLNEPTNVLCRGHVGCYDTYFHRKLSMNIAGVTFTNTAFTTARAVMTPPVTNGVYAWEASNNIRVAPIGNGQWAGLFLDDGAGGFVRCVWNNGKHDVWRLCTTAEVSVASCAYTNLTKFIDLRASPTLAVFEDSHLGTNGQPVMAGVTTSSLVCSYHGNRAGTLELSQVSGTAVALSEGDVPITMPFSWGVNGGGGDPDRVFNVSNLHVGEVAEFRLKFTNDLVPQGIDCLASIRAVTLVVQAERTWPMERYRHVFGPREVVALAAPDATGNVSWQFGTGTTNINPFSYLLPMTPGSVFLTLTVDGSSYSFPISVVGPSSVIGTNAVVMTDEDWIATGFAPLSIGEVGAGERIDLKFEPDYVSFVGLKTMEGFSQVYNKTGYFEQYNMSNVVHNAANGAGVVTTVGEENGVGRDRAGFAFTNAELPPPWADGGFEFRIPFYWWVDGSSQTNEVSTNVQSFTLFANGDAETSKFGWTVHRGTNGVSSVSITNPPPNPD